MAILAQQAVLQIRQAPNFCQLCRTRSPLKTGSSTGIQKRNILKWSWIPPPRDAEQAPQVRNDNTAKSADVLITTQSPARELRSWIRALLNLKGAIAKQ